MKTILTRFSLAALPLLFFSACRQATTSPATREMPTADICFEDTLHDFGTIPLSQSVDSFDFTFTNCGKGRLVILGVKTSCHCTKISYPHVPVEPGGQSFVRVVYDGRGRQAGFFNKSIRVISNARTEYVTLGIRGSLQ